MVDKRFPVFCLVVLLHYFCGTLAVGNTSVKCSEKERLSLLSLKSGFVDPYGCLSSWGNNGDNQMDCCKWDHVSCDNQTGHVVGLHLDGCDLEGTIVSTSLAELHHLNRLNLRDNNFTPTQFPSSILSLKKLQYLDLSDTNLKGNLPNFSHLCNLRDLYLSGNSLSGQLDDFVASFSHCAIVSLQVLDLSNNRFTGSLPNFSQFSFLENLYLSYNALNGTLNDGIGLLSKLKKLSIHDNFLHVVIYETHFLRLSQLQFLSLSFNDLEFKISPDWIPPFQLIYIGLSSCKLGPGFPTWLRTQKSFSYLDILNAKISGTVPSWFWDFKFQFINISRNQLTGKMQHFKSQNPVSTMDFSSNMFEGSIPSSLSHKVLVFLDLSNNKFTNASTMLCPKKTVDLLMLNLSNNQLLGVLPDCWRYFKSMVVLNVQNNSLSGKIPTSMGSLTNIQSLHLGYNNFNGEIPLSMCKCTKLVVFDVAHNNLTGLIPNWIGDELMELRVLILRSNMFYGSLPPNICNLSQVQILDLSLNNISGSLPKCLNHLSALANQTNFAAPAISYDSDSPDHMYLFLFLMKDIVSLMWKGKESKYQSTLGLVKSIDLSRNMLMGEIPSELMDLVGLVSLNISRNMFSGQIPATIGQLKLLDSLDLARNNLSGHIPFTALTNRSS